MIIPEHKIAFVHASKCGGSSVENLLFDHLGVTSRVNSGRWEDLNESEKGKYWVGGQDRQHWTLAQLKTKFGLEAWRVFGITRDPVQRAVSEFYYQRRVLGVGGGKEAIGPYVESDVSAAIEKGLLWRLAYSKHDVSQRDMFKGGGIELLKLEEVDREFPEFFRRLFGVSKQLPKVNASQRPKHTEITSEAKHLLWDRWGADYAFCGYEEPEEYRQRVPRRVWWYWDRGLAGAPKVAKASLESWRTLNPGWSVKVLDETSKEVLEAEYLYGGKEICAAHKADFIRLHLMSKYGGVWADATTLCLKPLSSWLDANVGTGGMFVFRNHPVANWFIAAKRGSRAADAWLRECESHWRGRTTADSYTWMHQAFSRIESRGLVGRMGWVDSSDRYHLGPHLLTPYGADANGTPGKMFFPRLLQESPPMLKMTWKHEIAPGSKFDILVNSFL